jgi:hypothetical protein
MKKKKNKERIKNLKIEQKKNKKLKKFIIEMKNKGVVGFPIITNEVEYTIRLLNNEVSKLELLSNSRHHNKWISGISKIKLGVKNV